MPATHCENTIAFVEGMMERIFINVNFPNIKVITVTNGCSWSVDALCRQIKNKYKVSNTNAKNIIVWVDREKRTETCHQIRRSIKNSLVSAGADPDIIHICIPNLMTENIILSDAVFVQSEFGIENYIYDKDGQNGKNILSDICKNYKSINYKETFHGVNYLKKIRLRRISLCNESVKSFIENLGWDCWWFGE